LWRGRKKPNGHAEPTKVERFKNTNKHYYSRITWANLETGRV